MAANYYNIAQVPGAYNPQSQGGFVGPQLQPATTPKPKAVIKPKRKFFRDAGSPTVYDDTGRRYTSEKEFLDAGGKWNEITVKQPLKVEPKKVDTITKTIGAPPSPPSKSLVFDTGSKLPAYEAALPYRDPYDPYSKKVVPKGFVGPTKIKEKEARDYFEQEFAAEEAKKTPAQRVAFDQAQLVSFISMTPTSDLVKRKYGDNVLTKIAGFAFNQVDPLVRDISDIQLANKVVEGVNSGKIDPSALDGIEVLKKTNLQVVGDVAQVVLLADMGIGAGGLVFKSATKQAMKEGLVALAKVGGKEGGLQGLQYGVALAMSSGSTDVNEITKIITTNAVFGAALGAGASTAIPAISKIIAANAAHTKAVRDDLAKGFMKQGYSKQEAMKLAEQGGYIGGVPNKPKADPLTTEARTIKAYHGTDAKFDDFDFSLTGKASGEGKLHGLEGTWFVNNKNVAKGYGKNLKESNIDITDFHVVDAKGKTLNDFRDELWDAKKLVKDEGKKGLVVKNLVDNADYSKSDVGDHIFVVNKSALKPKENPLLSEARKYKSAEEFVNSFNLMKWGEVTGVGDLPISKLSKSQMNVLLKEGLPTGKGKLGMSANVTDTSNKSLKVGDFQSGKKVVQPIEVSQRGNSYVIENGRHRLFQALANGDETIPVVFKNGEGKGYVKTTKSQLTDIWKEANKKTPKGVSPRLVAQDQVSKKPQTPTRELKQSQLATENLARTVTKQKPLQRVKVKSVSYADSITKPIINQDEAKTALMRATAGDVKVPKHYPNLVKDIDVINQKGKFDYKDISGFKGQARDVYRNFKAFFKDKFPEAKKQILDPFDAAKGRYVTEQKSLLKKLKTVTDDLGIKKGSKESAAVMDYGEKLVTKEQLIKKFGQVKANNIVEADKFFRAEYDRLLEEVNAIRAKIYPNDPTKIIPKRQDYYRHFQELSGFEGLKNVFESPSNIDPSLVGVSAFTTPRSKWLAFAQRRVGFKSDRDAVGGFLEYIPSATYAKHIDPQIGNFRRLAQDLAVQTIDSRNANNFIEFLQDYANDLSGKTNAADRFVQKVVGRKVFGVINWLNQRVKANTILGNASSAIAQVFNVPQGIASAKQYSVPGVLRTMGGIFTDNIPMSKSTFINERFIQSSFNAFDERLLAQPKKFAVWSLGVFDELGTKFTWNAHYAKGVAKKVADPIKYADDATRALVAGRGIGEVPLLQKSKLFQVIAPFQLEVGNLWYVMSDMVKAKDFGGLAVLFAANFLFNRVAESVRGSDVVFDPINALYEGILALNAEEDKKKGALKLGGRLAGEVASNIPLGQTLASLYPEFGFEKFGNLTREEFMGEGDPTRYGGGLLATKGLKDPLFKVLPPFAGAQIKKTTEGLGAYLKGRVTDKEGKTQFTIDKNPINFVRSVLFGKYATPEAKKSFEKSDAEDLPPEVQRVKSIYDQAQALKAEGKDDEALALYKGLSDVDKEMYASVKSDDIKKKKGELKPQVFETYRQAQQLKADGKEDEALQLYKGLDETSKDVYATFKKKYKDTDLEDLLKVNEEERVEDKSETSFIKDVVTYAEALGTDPVTAFDRILTGQKIRRVDNGAIIVERSSMAETQSVKQTRGSTGSLKLDHTIPLQLGGSNSEDNLKLVTEEEWASYTPVENKLGRLLKDKKVDKKEAQRLMKDFKNGIIKAEEILSR